MDKHGNAVLAYKKFIERHSPLTEATWSLLENVVKTGSLRKGDYLLEEGKVCAHVDFIYEGSLRAFSNKDGSEVTTAIYLEGTCVTSMKSFSTATPSSLSIQALEPTVYARIYKKDLESLYSSSTEMQIIGHAILEAMLIQENEWKEMYSLYDPEERYLFLMKKSPGLINRVPVQYIASFLGIRRETLSRIRNRTAKKS